MRQIKLSLVIPVHNETENLAPLAAEIRQALSPEHDFEMIFVDDGSDDDSRNRPRQLRRQYPELRWLRHRHCHGQSQALISGIKRARHPLIVTLDGDGQNDPADIDKLLRRYLLEPAPREKLMLAGRRRQRRDNLERRVASWVTNQVRARLLGGRTLSVEVRHRPRKQGSSHYGAWKRLGHGLIDLIGVAWLMRRSQAVETEEEEWTNQ